MQSVVEAAWIAAGAGVLGVVGTVTVAVTGFRSTRKITDQTIQAAAQESIRARNDARADRLWERKATAYAAFMTHARSYRNALRPLEDEPESRLSADDMEILVANADSAASLVFIVLESRATYDACSTIIRAISTAQSTLKNKGTHLSKERATKLNNHIAQLLRTFQVAAREELGVRGVDSSLILTRHGVPTKALLEE